MKVANDFHPFFFLSFIGNLQNIHIWINLFEYGSSIIRNRTTNEREERGRFRDATIFRDKWV